MWCLDDHACVHSPGTTLTCLMPPENKVVGVEMDGRIFCFNTGPVECLGSSWWRNFRISGVLTFWSRKNKIAVIYFTPTWLGSARTVYIYYLMQNSRSWIGGHTCVWVNAYTHTHRAQRQASSSFGIYMNVTGWVTYGVVGISSIMFSDAFQ